MQRLNWIRFTPVVFCLSTAVSSQSLGKVACAKYFADQPGHSEALELGGITSDFFSFDFAAIGRRRVAYLSFGTLFWESISFAPLDARDRGRFLFGNMTRHTVQRPTDQSLIYVGMDEFAAPGAVWEVRLDGHPFVSISRRARMNPELLNPTTSTLPFARHGPLDNDFAFVTGPERLMRARATLTVSQRITGLEVAFIRSVTFVRNPETLEIESVEFRETQLHGSSAGSELAGTAISSWTRRFLLSRNP